MDIERLIKIRDKADLKASKIRKILITREKVLKSIEDIKYLKNHAGRMLFTGSSGKIEEENTMLKTVEIGILSGCLEVPALLFNLAEKKLTELEVKANDILFPREENKEKRKSKEK